MWSRFAWWLMPPVLVIAALFSAQWAWASAKVNADEQAKQLQQQQLAEQQAQAAAAVAATKAQQQFSLEIRSLGITVDRYRQLAIWQQLDKTNHPHRTMLSQDPNDYEWAGETRQLQYEKRATDAYENAVRMWTERWPIPTLVADSTTSGRGINRIFWMQFQSGTPTHLLTALGTQEGEHSDALVKQLFKAFDDHPELPAVLVLVADSQEDDLAIRKRDERFVPKQPDAAVAFLVTRTDRVDKYIRPYVVDVPYKINLEDTQYDVIKLWNFYWDEVSAYRDIPKHFDIIPTSLWTERVQ